MLQKSAARERITMRRATQPWIVRSITLRSNVLSSFHGFLIPPTITTGLFGASLTIWHLFFPVKTLTKKEFSGFGCFGFFLIYFDIFFFFFKGQFWLPRAIPSSQGKLMEKLLKLLVPIVTIFTIHEPQGFGTLIMKKSISRFSKDVHPYSVRWIWHRWICPYPCFFCVIPSASSGHNCNCVFVG